VQTEEIKKFLEDIKWPDGLSTDKTYQIECDDIPDKKAMVKFSCDGDAWVGAKRDGEGLPTLCRFRTSGGGGHSFYTRQAIMILALAMEIDNED